MARPALDRLEELYNTKRGPPNTLNYLIRDVVPKMPKGYRCTLFDIGLVINQLMGSGYMASYVTRKSRGTPSMAASAARKVTTKMNGFLNAASSTGTPSNAANLPQV